MRSKPASDSDTVSTGAHAMSAGVRPPERELAAEPLVHQAEAVHARRARPRLPSEGGPARGSTGPARRPR